MSYNAHYKRPAFVEYEAFVLINIWARTLAPTNWMKLHIRTDVRALVCGRVLLQTKYLRTYLPTHTHSSVSCRSSTASRLVCCLLVHSSPFYAGKNALSHMRVILGGCFCLLHVHVHPYNTQGFCHPAEMFVDISLTTKCICGRKTIKTLCGVWWSQMLVTLLFAHPEQQQRRGSRSKHHTVQ